MRKTTIMSWISLLVIGLALLMAGCKRIEENGAGAVGRLLQYGGCKNWSAGGTLGGIHTQDQDCIEYRYDGQKLELKHVNAGFNCCPEEITASIQIKGQTISICEREAAAGCYCQCLYDLDYVIEDLLPGEYVIQVEEPYLGKNEPLTFKVQLAPGGASGSHCVARSHYPWGTPTGQ